MEFINTYLNVRFLHQVGTLNNLGARLMSQGDFDAAAATCRDGLKIMKLVNNGFAIDQVFSELEAAVQHAESRLHTLESSSSQGMNSGIVHVLELSIMDFQSPNLVELFNVSGPVLCSLWINTSDFDTFVLPTSDLLCAILMYNMATAHLVDSHRINDANFVSSKLQASRCIFELALHVVEMQQKDINQCEICMTISGLINASLSYIAQELGDINVAKSFQEISQKRARDLFRISSFLGSCTQRSAAAA
jgi:hypothetical protein